MWVMILMAKEFKETLDKPIKKKKKSNHISNERITEPTTCDICGRNNATSTHEWFYDGTSVSRNYCIANNYQYKLCAICHERIHNDNKFNKKHQSARRREIMVENKWFTVEEWLNNTPFNKMFVEKED